MRARDERERERASGRLRKRRRRRASLHANEGSQTVKWEEASSSIQSSPDSNSQPLAGRVQPIRAHGICIGLPGPCYATPMQMLRFTPASSRPDSAAVQHATERFLVNDLDDRATRNDALLYRFHEDVKFDSRTSLESRSNREQCKAEFRIQGGALYIYIWTAHTSEQQLLYRFTGRREEEQERGPRSLHRPPVPNSGE